MRTIKYAGYTILELSITLAIALILILASSQTWHHIAIKTRVSTQIATLKTALQLARSEAIRFNLPIIVCPSQNQQTCGGAWRDGYIITTTAQQVLHTFAPTPTADQLFWRSSLGQNDAITFAPSGTTGGQQGSFYYCPYNHSKFARAIIIKQTGRIRIAAKTSTNRPIPCPG